MRTRLQGVGGVGPVVGGTGAGVGGVGAGVGGPNVAYGKPKTKRNVSCFIVFSEKPSGREHAFKLSRLGRHHLHSTGPGPTTEIHETEPSPEPS